MQVKPKQITNTVEQSFILSPAMLINQVLFQNISTIKSFNMRGYFQV